MSYGSINRNIFLVLFTLLSIFILSSFERDLPVQANDSKPVSLPSEGRYKVNASQSKFTVKAFAGGLLSAFAHDHLIAIRDFTGDVRFTYGTVEPASLELNIKAASLTLLDKVSDSDRQKIENTMRTEVLEIDKHPEIVFKSTNVSAQRVEEGKYQTKIAGELTLHGVTHPIAINATVEFSQNSLQAEGQFALRQTDFGIKPVSI